MTKFKVLLCSAAALLLSTQANAGELQIKVVPGVLVKTGEFMVLDKYRTATSIKVTAMVKNATDTDYATVAWSCELRDVDHYKIGYGSVVFHNVPKNTIAIGETYFYQNGITRGAECKIANLEERSKENERLYTFELDVYPISKTPYVYWDKTEDTLGHYNDGK